MSKFNSFRPTINALEDRSLMSATLATAVVPSEPVPYTVKLEDVLISSYQSGGHESFTKVGLGDVIFLGETSAAGSGGISAGKVSFSDLSVMVNLETGTIDPVIISGDQPQAASHKETIEIQSWSFGAPNPTAAAELTKVGTGTLEFNGVQVDSREVSSPSVSEIVVTK